MHPDLHRYLDGELPREALGPEAAAEADVWDALLGEMAQFRAERAPAWLEQRIMNALPAAEPRPFWRRVLAWLLEPRSVRVRPISVALAGALGAVVLAAPYLDRAEPAAPEAVAGAAAGPGEADASRSVVYVQFVLTAPNARSVSLVGDFNGWEPEGYPLHDLDGDGVWTGLVALPPGMHKYMFVVDGNRWVTDPRAERYVDDGFGMRNALISVAAPPGRTS
ncbi:MAG TPA: isoamylase early set domain-containing protein [Longimicrobiales bacterium]